jgi:hypothetical protein
MPADGFVGNRKEAAIGAIRAFNSGLFTDAANPFIGARWSIAGFASPVVLKPARINVFPATKKRAK